jgi:mannose-6-phosphate isomerase-like protein (cupin superfamily)
MKVIEKPWGKEEILEANDKYVVKKLYIKKGHRLSRQYHEYKHETLYLLKGKAKVNLNIFMPEDTIIDMSVGDYIVINPKHTHRIEAIKDCEFLECSTPELWDTVIISDDYGRN